MIPKTGRAGVFSSHNRRTQIDPQSHVQRGGLGSHNTSQQKIKTDTKDMMFVPSSINLMGADLGNEPQVTDQNTLNSEDKSAKLMWNSPTSAEGRFRGAHPMAEHNKIGQASIAAETQPADQTQGRAQNKT